ncbi:MAG: hypothetical protein IJB71_00325 [Bacilli bacterium]|nr:hypothetical protein [Bacilli bacterium]
MNGDLNIVDLQSITICLEQIIKKIKDSNLISDENAIAEIDQLLDNGINSLSYEEFQKLQEKVKNIIKDERIQNSTHKKYFNSRLKFANQSFENIFSTFDKKQAFQNENFEDHFKPASMNDVAVDSNEKKETKKKETIRTNFKKLLGIVSKSDLNDPDIDNLIENIKNMVKLGFKNLSDDDLKTLKNNYEKLKSKIIKAKKADILRECPLEEIEKYLNTKLHITDLQKKEGRIERRQRSIKIPIPTKAKKAEAASKQEENASLIKMQEKAQKVISSIDNLIYRLGNQPYDNDIRRNAVAKSQEIQQLFGNAANIKAIADLTDELKKAEESLQLIFNNYESKRKSTDYYINEALEKQQQELRFQKEDVLDDDELNKYFYVKQKKRKDEIVKETPKGKYVKMLSAEETKPYLAQLKKLESELGRNHPEYQAVAQQFMDYARKKMGRSATKDLIKKLQNSNVILKSGNRIEIPKFLLEIDEIKKNKK